MFHWIWLLTPWVTKNYEAGRWTQRSFSDAAVRIARSVKQLIANGTCRSYRFGGKKLNQWKWFKSEETGTEDATPLSEQRIKKNEADERVLRSHPPGEKPSSRNRRRIHGRTNWLQVFPCHLNFRYLVPFRSSNNGHQHHNYRAVLSLKFASRFHAHGEHGPHKNKILPAGSIEPASSPQ